MGPAFQPATAGEYVRGTLAGSTNLASGRYAMIDDGLEFSLVPWQQPVLDQRVGRHIAGVMRGDGGIEWESGQEARAGTLTVPGDSVFHRPIFSANRKPFVSVRFRGIADKDCSSGGLPP